MDAARFVRLVVFLPAVRRIGFARLIDPNSEIETGLMLRRLLPVGSV